ncbi:hypothetical protein PIROE2DRAFT_12235 [Piromyces sp. E2]|nr:hypothetical protein PIROE2DRAFT_12235 [Piromyces sp. E2]|eukprot:OUM61692.1 hypothetical protein PIROE2DRAFT_12235 [Piromyces sp. E2]
MNLLVLIVGLVLFVTNISAGNRNGCAEFQGLENIYCDGNEKKGLSLIVENNFILDNNKDGERVYSHPIYDLSSYDINSISEYKEILNVLQNAINTNIKIFSMRKLI